MSLLLLLLKAALKGNFSAVEALSSAIAATDILKQPTL